jgi:tRNA threonylcarbamoyladenosine biosynthesis protein TsaE
VKGVTAEPQVALRVPTAEHMRMLGAEIGRVAQPGDLFLLEGPFGAGKTTFVQGLATGLEVDTPVSSPSFVIEHQHAGRLPLVHIDLYRLERLDAEVLESLEEHLYAEDGVTAVEWSERLPSAVREAATLLRFELTEDGGRAVRVETREERLRAAARAAGARW